MYVDWNFTNTRLSYFFQNFLYSLLSVKEVESLSDKNNAIWAKSLLAENKPFMIRSLLGFIALPRLTECFYKKIDPDF